MALDRIPGYGRKRFQLDVDFERLHLDVSNPRLPANIQGKSESEVLRALYEDFSLEEIAISMSQNGYFDEEPLVAIPREIPEKLLKAGAYKSPDFKAFVEKKTTHFTVVEGNRRLATIKILLDGNLQRSLGKRSWPELSREVREDLSILPVIIYSAREQVVPYLGVRHITGIKKWEAYAKARYIINMLDTGFRIEDIEQRIGDRQGAGRKSVICYRMLEQAAEEFEYDINKTTGAFSYLILSIGQGPIRRYLGLPSRLKEISLTKPVDTNKLGELKNLLSWLFGDEKHVHAVVDESRDITDYLSAVVSSPEAVKYLEKTRKLQDAYELSDGEETMLKKILAAVNNKLETALGIAHRHKTPEIKAEIEKCYETVKRLFKTATE